MRRMFLGSVLAVCFIASTHAVFSQDNFGSQWIVSIKICEETPAGNQPKILAEPTIAAITGRPFSFSSTGAVKPKIGDGDLEMGTRLIGKLEPTDNGLVRLAMTIRIGSAVAQEDDPHTSMVRTESMDIRTVLRPGRAKRLKCSATQWCEVIVEGIK